MSTNTIEKKSFGTLSDGEEVQCYTFKNSLGTVINLLDFGLTIQKLLLSDKKGVKRDVVLGFDTISGYESNHPFFGCLVGPSANRIKNGRVVIDGKEVQLVQNEGENQLHSGKGFQQRVWECSLKEDRKGVPLLECVYVKKAGEEGFPGNLKTKVTFQLTDDNILDMHYKATTDAATVVNLTRHDYFNLKDGGVSGVFDHKLQLNARQITEKDVEGIPTGILKDIKGTSYDFSSLSKIKANLDKKSPDLMPIAFDDNYVLDQNEEQLVLAARLVSPDNERTITFFTTQPGLQFYTGVHTKEQYGKNGIVYQPYSGLCLEAQHFPDAPNHPNFESTILQPDEVYKQQLQYRFGSKE